MRKQTCTFDRLRAIGFRLLFGAIFLPGAAHAEWLTRSENIMGTRCSVELWSDDRARGEAAISSVFDDMKRIDRLMSTWKEDTEISKVNREGGKHPVKISPELFRLLQVSVEYSELTRGAFDITYASVGYLYDFKKGVHPDQKAIDQALPGINWRHMVLDASNTTVFFARPGMRIDLGSAGKGYAVDRAIARLRGNGVQCALLHGGTSSVHAIGVPGSSDGWRIGWSPERAPARTFELHDSALAVSAVHGKAFRANGRVFGHVMDPHTGQPADVAGSAVVAGPDSLLCDALSTALLVRGAHWLPVLNERFPGYAGMVA